MAEKFQRFFQTAYGRLWYGRCRTGMDAAVELCRQFDAPGINLFSDRRKIRTGSIGNYFIKRYNLPGFWTQLRRLFKKPRAVTVLNGAEFLLKLGIPTPPVQAVVTEVHGLHRREYLITDLLDPADTLLNVMAKSAEPGELFRLLMTKFIPMLAVLHDSGAAHGDLSMRNLYRTAAGEAGLIDLDGICICRKPAALSVRAKEIARLISSYIIVAKVVDDNISILEEALQEYQKVSGVKIPEKNAVACMKKFMSGRKKK